MLRKILQAAEFDSEYNPQILKSSYCFYTQKRVY